MSTASGTNRLCAASHLTAKIPMVPGLLQPYEAGDHQGVSMQNQGWFACSCPELCPTNVTNILHSCNNHTSAPQTLHCCNARKSPISRCPQLPPAPQTRGCVGGCWHPGQSVHGGRVSGSCCSPAGQGDPHAVPAPAPLWGPKMKQCQ